MRQAGCVRPPTKLHCAQGRWPRKAAGISLQTMSRRRPFFWVEHADWLWVLMALTERDAQWPDAPGLGLFT